jgi:uncharacterized membrane protein YqaE (UPF0057 family)
MALVSILLAVLAFICTLAGFLTTPIPVLGAVLSFAAAAIALTGIILGGRAVSAAKRSGMPNDAARISVVLNVLAFVPALLVALTCGLCNAAFSTGNVQLQKSVNFGLGPGVPFDDAGMPIGPGRPEPPLRKPPRPDGVPAPAPGNPSEPPANLPPPPLPAGPHK